VLRSVETIAGASSLRHSHRSEGRRLLRPLAVRICHEPRKKACDARRSISEQRWECGWCEASLKNAVSPVVTREEHRRQWWRRSVVVSALA